MLYSTFCFINCQNYFSSLIYGIFSLILDVTSNTPLCNVLMIWVHLFRFLSRTVLRSGQDLFPLPSVRWVEVLLCRMKTKRVHTTNFYFITSLRCFLSRDTSAGNNKMRPRIPRWINSTPVAEHFLLWLRNRQINFATPATLTHPNHCGVGFFCINGNACKLKCV